MRSRLCCDLTDVLEALLACLTFNRPGSGLLATSLLTGLKPSELLLEHGDLTARVQLIRTHEATYVEVKSRAIQLTLIDSDRTLTTSTQINLSLPNEIGEALASDLKVFADLRSGRKEIRALLKHHGFAPRITWVRLADAAKSNLIKGGLESIQLYSEDHKTCYAAENSDEITTVHFRIASQWLAQIDARLQWEFNLPRQDLYAGTKSIVTLRALGDTLKGLAHELQTTQELVTHSRSHNNIIAHHNARAIYTQTVYFLMSATRPLVSRPLLHDDIDFERCVVSIPNKRRASFRFIPLPTIALNALREFISWCKSLEGIFAKEVWDSIYAEAPLIGIFQVERGIPHYQKLLPVTLANTLFDEKEVALNWSRKTTINYLDKHFYNSHIKDAYIDHDNAEATATEMTAISDCLDSWVQELLK